MSTSIAVPTAGPAGSAFGSAGKWCESRPVDAISVAYEDSAPVTTTVDVLCGEDTLLSVTGNESRTYAVRVPAVTPEGAPIAGVFVPPWVRGSVAVEVGDSDPVDPAAVIVRLLT